MNLRAVSIAVAFTLVAGGGDLFVQRAVASTPEPATVAPVPTLNPSRTKVPSAPTPTPTPAPMGRTKAMPPALEQTLADRLERLEREVLALTKRVATLESEKAAQSAAIAALRGQFEHHKHCLPGYTEKFIAAIGRTEDPLHSVSPQVPLSQVCTR
jgi:hypothetical protein